MTNDKTLRPLSGHGVKPAFDLFRQEHVVIFFADAGFFLPHFFVSCCKNDMVGMNSYGHGPLDVIVITQLFGAPGEVWLIL